MFEIFSLGCRAVLQGVDQLATRRKGKLVGDTCHKSHSKADRIDCFLDEIEN
jgi:hypothetical protein